MNLVKSRLRYIRINCHQNLFFLEKLQIIVAAGPFSVSDKLDYEPLQDLLKHVTELKPNILILMGPFIDNTHSNILDIAETFEKHFTKLIKDVMDCLIG